MEYSNMLHAIFFSMLAAIGGCHVEITGPAKNYTLNLGNPSIIRNFWPRYK